MMVSFSLSFQGAYFNRPSVTLSRKRLFVSHQRNGALLFLVLSYISSPMEDYILGQSRTSIGGHILPDNNIAVRPVRMSGERGLQEQN